VSSRQECTVLVESEEKKNNTTTAVATKRIVFVSLNCNKECEF
jgi:hypothetical protein